MNKHFIKQQAKLLLKQINHDISIDTLEEKTGYRICFYNGENLSGDSVIAILGLKEYADVQRSFCCQRDDKKFIFIQDNQKQKDKLFLILHEIAHLMLNHTDPDELSFERSQRQEREADFFADIILNYEKQKTKFYRLALLLVILGCVGFFIGRAIFITSYCFITPTGEKYHKGCNDLKANSTVTWITINKAKEMGYEPCKKCIPQ